MYSFIPLFLATAVLALPQQIREEPSSTAAATTPCPGAPAIPEGAIPGDFCGGGGSSNASASAPSDAPSNSSSSSASQPSSSAAVPSSAPSRRKIKRRVNRKRDGGFSSCQTIKIEDYDSSPIKDPIEAIAKKNWGDGFKTVVNPPDFPNQPIKFCYSSDTIPVSFSTKPSCSTSQNNIAGNVENGTADAQVTINQGTTATHQVSIDKAVSLSSATEVGITLGIPGDEVDVKETVTIQGTLTKGDTETTAINQQHIQQVTAHATKPGPCNIKLNVTTCTGSGTATVPGFYTGSVWFNYGSRKDGHFKWSLNVDALLPAEQRSDNMTLTDKLTSSTNGEFTTNCV